MRFIVAISIIFLSFSCSSEKTEKPKVEGDILLASFDNSNLFLSEVSDNLYRNMNPGDSIYVLNSFVEEWLKEEAYIQKANLNISDKLDIEKRVDKFKKELVKSSYNKMVLNSLELELTEEEIKAYYEKHKNFFVFQEDFLEIEYILLPKSTSNLQQIKKAISKGEKSNWINNYCRENSLKCKLEEGVFKSKIFLMEEFKMPVYLLNPSENFYYHYIDSENVLIYNIKSYKKTGEIAPLEMVKIDVEKIALHTKKQEYLLELEDKTYQKAKNDKLFEKYIN